MDLFSLSRDVVSMFFLNRTVVLAYEIHETGRRQIQRMLI